MPLIADFLRRRLKHKEIGWKDIGEEFTRYAIWRGKRFNIYLHRLYAPNEAPQCHDHPWSFVTILLWNGYLEWFEGQWHRRFAGTIMRRKATDTHNVITPYGVCWSLIITTKKSRDWSFKSCPAD
jgi:hypothetical protein